MSSLSESVWENDWRREPNRVSLESGRRLWVDESLPLAVMVIEDRLRHCVWFGQVCIL